MPRYMILCENVSYFSIVQLNFYTLINYLANYCYMFDKCEIILFSRLGIYIPPSTGSLLIWHNVDKNGHNSEVKE